MKVFGVNLDGKSRGIVAAKSQKNAAELFKMSLYHFREYGAETGNLEEIALATKEPLVVWKQEYKYGAPWVRVTPNVQIDGQPALGCPARMQG